VPRPEKIRTRLRNTVGSDTSVRLGRVSRPDQIIKGFVVAVGAKWALLEQIMDGGFFDGHVAIRLNEIANVRADTSFEPVFARTQPEWPPAPPHNAPVDLNTTRGMLASLLRQGQLLGIERDKKYDGTWIGVPNELTRHWLYLWEVRPDATWHEQPLGYRLRTITMVTVNNHHQRGLAAIAGSAPADASPPNWAEPER
jgi:hypothetical protein